MAMQIPNRRAISTTMLANSAPQTVLTPQDSLRKPPAPKFPVPITAEEDLMKLAWTVACLPPILPKFA